MLPLRPGLLAAYALAVGIASPPTLAGASALGDWRESPELITILLDGFEAGDACSWTESVGLGEICAATVIEVQSGVHAGDVGLSGVFLTAFSADHKHFWAADALAGAAWNGIYFYRGPGATVLDGSFQIGGSVDVSGTVAEFDASPPGETFTEILTGLPTTNAPAGSPPTPLTGVSVATLASLASGEPYEGVLVQVSTVKVAASGASDQLTLQDNSGDIVVMDDLAFDYAASSYPVGTCFATVTGIMHVDGTNNVRILLPRLVADLVTGFGCL